MLIGDLADSREPPDATSDAEHCPSWKRSIHEQLVLRNKLQAGDGLGKLYGHYDDMRCAVLQARGERLQMQHEIKRLRLLVADRGREISRILEGKAPLSDISSLTARSGDVIVDPAIGTGRAHGSRRSDSAPELVRAARRGVALEERLVAAEHDIVRWKKSASEAEREVARIAAKLVEEETALRLLQEEVESQRVMLANRERENKQLVKENKQLIKRWISKMTQEAEKLNSANEMYNSKAAATKRETLLRNAEKGLRKASSLDAAKFEATRHSDNPAVEAERGGSLSHSSPAPRSDAGYRIPTVVSAVLKAHDSAVLSLSAFGSGSNMVISGSADKGCKLWNSDSGDLVGALVGSTSAVTQVGVSPGGNLLMAACADSSTRIWGKEMGRCRHTLSGHRSKVYTAVFSSNSPKVVSGSHDCSIKTWDLGIGFCTHTILCSSPCTHLALSRDERMMYSAHLDSVLRVWDRRASSKFADVKGTHKREPITCVIALPADKSVVTMGLDNRLRVIDTRNFRVLHTMSHVDCTFSSSVIGRAGLSPCGKYVAAGGVSGDVFIWSVQSGGLERILNTTGLDKEPRGASGVECCAWSPEGDALIGGTQDGTIVYWRQ